MEDDERELKVVHQLLQFIEDTVEAADDCKLKGDLAFLMQRYRDYQLARILFWDSGTP